MSEDKQPTPNPNGITAESFAAQVGSFTGGTKPSTDDIIASYLSEKRSAEPATKVSNGTTQGPSADIQALMLQNKQLMALVAKAQTNNNAQQQQNNTQSQEPDWEAEGLTGSDKKLLDTYLNHSLKDYEARVNKLQNNLNQTLLQQQQINQRDTLEQGIKHELKKAGLPEEAAIIASMYARDNNIPAREAVQHARQTVKVLHNALRQKALDRQSNMPFIAGELKDRSGNTMSGDTQIEVNNIADRAQVLKALFKNQ